MSDWEAGKFVLAVLLLLFFILFKPLNFYIGNWINKKRKKSKPRGILSAIISGFITIFIGVSIIPEIVNELKKYEQIEGLASTIPLFIIGITLTIILGLIIRTKK